MLHPDSNIFPRFWVQTLLDGLTLKKGTYVIFVLQQGCGSGSAFVFKKFQNILKKGRKLVIIAIVFKF